MGEPLTSQQSYGCLYTQFQNTELPLGSQLTLLKNLGVVVSSSSCAGPKSICPSMTSLSRDANFAMAPRAPSAALAGFEAKLGETVATGFEAETSKPRCRRVSPRPRDPDRRQVSPGPAPLGPPCHLHWLPARLDLVFTPSSSAGRF